MVEKSTDLIPPFSKDWCMTSLLILSFKKENSSASTVLVTLPGTESIDATYTNSAFHFSSFIFRILVRKLASNFFSMNFDW